MSKMSKIWKDRSVTKETKIRLVRSLVFSIATYGAETWTIKMNMRKRIDAFEMWCWRRMLRVSWTEHRTNQSVADEIQIPDQLSKIINRSILKYYGHISRRDDDNLERLIIQGKMEGKRPRGRSPRRWTDQVKELSKRPLAECSRIAKNREEWREVVLAAD